MKSSALYKVVNGRRTGTKWTRINRVKIEEKDSACSAKAAFAGAGEWQGGR